MREPKALWSVEEITDNRCKDHTCTCSIDCVTKIKFGLIIKKKKLSVILPQMKEAYKYLHVHFNNVLFHFSTQCQLWNLFSIIYGEVYGEPCCYDSGDNAMKHVNIYTYKYTCIMSNTCSCMWYKLVVYKKSVRHIYFQETTIFRKLKSASAIWNVWLMASLFFTSYFHFSWNHVWFFT